MMSYYAERSLTLFFTLFPISGSTIPQSLSISPLSDWSEVVHVVNRDWVHF